MRDAAAALPRPVAFVPTMGALHAGHLALVARAKANAASVAASVFVNPLQFAPGEDFSRYPRDLQADKESLERAGVDLLFTPQATAMYPPEFSTAIDPGPVAERYEGAVRPGHFRGVATVVVKLLEIVAPDTLFLGQKDAQQTAVLRRVLEDLSFPVGVEIVETVREPDGLALSSRNAYLNPELREAAPSLHRALVALRDAVAAGVPKSDAIAAARAALSPLAVAEYFDVVDERTFSPLDALRAPAFVIGAARFGTTRLIDNLWVRA